MIPPRLNENAPRIADLEVDAGLQPPIVAPTGSAAWTNDQAGSVRKSLRAVLGSVTTVRVRAEGSFAAAVGRSARPVESLRRLDVSSVRSGPSQLTAGDLVAAPSCSEHPASCPAQLSHKRHLRTTFTVQDAAPSPERPRASPDGPFYSQAPSAEMSFVSGLRDGHALLARVTTTAGVAAVAEGGAPVRITKLAYRWDTDESSRVKARVGSFSNTHQGRVVLRCHSLA